MNEKHKTLLERSEEILSKSYKTRILAAEKELRIAEDNLFFHLDSKGRELLNIYISKQNSLSSVNKDKWIHIRLTMASILKNQ